MDIQPPDPSILLRQFVCIQQEIFVNISAHFSANVSNKNKNLFSRAIDFSKDFNNCEPFNFEHLKLSEDNFSNFCNFAFDFMDYVRKLDENLYNDSIAYARTQMSFPTMPTLDMSVAGCGSSISLFLDMREKGTLPERNDNFTNDFE
jgi:hypothetical protein